MKKIMLSLAVTSISAGIVFSSCDSAATKEKEAQEKVTEAKDELTEVKKDANAEAVRLASNEEWTEFKKETEIKIADNDARIAALKSRKSKSDKLLDNLYERRIDTLEVRNKNLKMRIADFQITKNDWEAFKREFNSDMEGLGEALKSFGENNKK